MEIFYATLHGSILALGLIMPLGMQNLFIFNQGATQKRMLHTLPSVITASICDTILIILSVLGVSLLILQLSWLKLTLFIASFFFFIYIGYITWNKATIKLSEKKKAFSAKKQILFTTSVSFFNPHAITDTIMVIGSNSIQYSGQPKFAYTISCIVVSWLWFYGIAFAGHKLHKSELWMKVINKVAALMIWAIAINIGKEIIEEIFY
ncbi:MAG: L-lysine exporter family protein LysE/ArgO [Candidatus Midichloriaceae bacterium]|jgi:L-lysine exporter family protein LysE/ArgO